MMAAESPESPSGWLLEERKGDIATSLLFVGEPSSLIIFGGHLTSYPLPRFLEALTLFGPQNTPKYCFISMHAR
jgi:hypothetical protein